MKHKVLFLCTGNSCRSQMAEGWAAALKKDLIIPYSAGIEKHGLNPYAVRAMAEAGIDISDHYSKTLSELAEINFDLVITVCDKAAESCPIFPGKTKVRHHSFADPPRLAAGLKDDKAIMDIYRKIRDEIRDFVSNIEDF